MTEKPKRTPRPPSLSRANDEAALHWAGSFGYAVLQTLRLTEHFAEADFWDFMGKAPHGGAGAAPPDEGGEMPLAARRPLLTPAESAPAHQWRLLHNPTGSSPSK
jgi:hypothetical protein